MFINYYDISFLLAIPGGRTRSVREKPTSLSNIDLLFLQAKVVSLESSIESNQRLQMWIASGKDNTRPKNPFERICKSDFFKYQKSFHYQRKTRQLRKSAIYQSLKNYDSVSN